MKNRLRKNLSPYDYLAILILSALTIIWAQLYFNFSAHPFEDAAILMRYSKHLAEGHGIVWNISESPVDGATDFLFMLMLAGVYKLGFSLEDGARLLGFFAHLATIYLIYFGIRLLTKSYFWAFVSALFVALGPGLIFVEAAFGTTVFAFFACLSWFFALILMERNESRNLAFCFGLTALITGLIRPEGVFLVGFMLLSLLFSKGWKANQLTLIYFIGIFLLIGGGYFLWRWDYFGYPLPNPFYKKGGGQLHLEMLPIATSKILALTFPFYFAFLFALLSKKALWRGFCLSVPIIGFTGLWVLLSDEMNYMARFQYAAMPILLLSYPILLRDFTYGWGLNAKFNRLDQHHRTLLITFMFLVTGFFGSKQPLKYAKITPFPDGRFDVALILREYKEKGYAMAVSEAGLLPLYSEWRAVDMWGLNDQWISHNGLVNQEYLDRYKPELILFNGPFLPLMPKDFVPKTEWQAQWYAMLDVVREYVSKREYVLVSAFGEVPRAAHHYYLRADISQKHPELVKRIREVKYYGGYFSKNGKAREDFANRIPEF